MCMMMHGMNHTDHETFATPNATPHGETLLEILKRRYVLGEITREQFEEMKQTLGVPDSAYPNEHSHH